MSIDYSKIRVSEICNIIKKDIKAGNGKQMLDRSSEGIIIAIKGELEYIHNGNVFVSDPSKILLVPKGITYRFRSITDSTSIVIDFNLAEQLDSETFISVKGDNTEFASKMEKQWTFKKDGYELTCLSILYGFFAKLCVDSVYIPSSRIKMIQPGIQFLEEHLLENSLRDEDLASACSISKTYFRYLFQKKYGVPPMRYVRLKRIERAKQIFDSGYYTSVWDVAIDSGFSDIYTFSKVFKKETGMTPTEYAHLSKG